MSAHRSKLQGIVSEFLFTILAVSAFFAGMSVTALVVGYQSYPFGSDVPLAEWERRRRLAWYCVAGGLGGMFGTICGGGMLIRWVRRCRTA
jgi:hypothetical protein